MRLSPATLSGLRPGVARFGYDRAALRPGIVHLGLGAFIRAHGLLYTEDVLARHGVAHDAWGVIGVSLRHPGQRDRLVPQAGLYTAVQRSPDGPDARVVGCLLDVLVAPEDPAAVLRRMAAPETRIVTLTVTEKGYCHAPATGRLDPDHPDIRHDLAHPAAPRSAPGFLLEALRRRRAAGHAPFTVLSCDNLAGNGALLHGVVRDLAAMHDDALAAWIDAAAFPCSMVDRIVPATTAAGIAAASAATGLHDAAPVLHEPFRQWVIEDRFVDDARPAWQEAGAQFVADVAPFERMKLRLLNAAHSALAYLGLLAGHATIREAVADPVLRRFVVALWDTEAIPAVPPPPGIDLQGYTRSLLERFDNPAIHHATAQIAMDGSQKVPQRLLSSIRERRGSPSPLLILAVAAWLRCARGRDAPADPMADELRRLLAVDGGAVSLHAVFGDDLSSDAPFVDALSKADRDLVQLGVRGAIMMRLPEDGR